MNEQREMFYKRPFPTLLRGVALKRKIPETVYVSGIRTRDTRIFSPMLYQLSYGTLSDCGAKVMKVFISTNRV